MTTSKNKQKMALTKDNKYVGLEMKCK